MHCVEYKFRRSMRELVSSGDRILVAVSGGPDSVAMLHLLNKLKLESLDFCIAIAHLNHLVRGADSKRDADFVEQLGKSLGIDTFVEEIDVIALNSNMKTSFQESARNIRYDFLDRTLKKWEGNVIALGHNADDQAETVLINMLRGSGLLGLTGIPTKRDHFIRPIHNCFRNEIQKYICAHNLEYCSDVTNYEKNYLRNKIRLELIPFLEIYNPQIRSSLSGTSRLLADDEDYLQGQVDRILAQSAETAMLEFPKLEVDFLKAQHPALQKRLIRQAILVVKGDLRAISVRHVLNILGFINYQTGSKELHLPGGLTAICSGGILSFYKSLRKQVSTLSSGDNEHLLIDINIPGLTNVGVRGLKFKAKLVSKENITDFSKNQSLAYLDYDKTGSKIKVRFFRPGDRFVPLGMKGSKKLKSFFIDEKIPKSERKSVPLLISKDGDIIWVYEKRIGENYRVTDKTRKILLLEGESS